jgi:adenylate cyclase
VSEGRSGRSVYRRTRLLGTFAVVLANLVGAIVVFVFATWVIPGPVVDDSTQVVLVNLAVFGAYLLVALAVGVLWTGRRLRVLRGWLVEEREPDEREQRMVLRDPAWVAFVAAVLWAVATAIAFGLNAIYDPLLGLSVALTVGLGGITTSAIAYLLTERVQRPVVARALATSPPDRPLAPGVIARSLLAWALGTGVPMTGLLVVAIFAVATEEVTRTELAITIFGLAGVSVLVGFFATLLAARAASDPVVAVRGALKKVEQGDLDVEVPIYDGSEVGLLQAGFNRMVAGLRDRRRIREAFGAYVDHDVAEHILDEGVSLRGEEIEVTLLFLDVRGFTNWAEKVDPGELVETLNDLFERAVPVVHEHGGHVDKFVGDGFLAVFGAPRRDERHADHALAAARDAAEALEDHPLEVGIGLNSGSVVAGNVGGGGRLEFSVMGDAVNVAARIEAATRATGDRILLSEETAGRLEAGRDGLEERPGVKLRGRSEPVTLYAAAR